MHTRAEPNLATSSTKKYLSYRYAPQTDKTAGHGSLGSNGLGAWMESGFGLGLGSWFVPYSPID